MKRLTRSEAIRKHCLQCAGDSALEVTLCTVLDCPLWRYRVGKEPENKKYKERFLRALNKDRVKDYTEILDFDVLAHLGVKRLPK